MASKRISELGAVSALDDDDLLVIIEDGATKKVTVAELREALGPTGDWTDAGEAWTRTGPNTFTAPGDLTALYRKGTRIKLTQTTDRYFFVSAVSHLAGTTTVTVLAGTTYTLADAAITSPQYSYLVYPEGYPHAFGWTPTWQTDNSNFTLSDGVSTGWYSCHGQLLHVFASMTWGPGTTTGTGGFYHSLPAAMAALGSLHGTGYALNNAVAEFAGVVMNFGGRIKTVTPPGTVWTSNAVPFAFANGDIFAQDYEYTF